MSTIASYVGDGSSREFDITFPYRLQSSVRVSVDEVEVPFSFLTSNRVILDSAPAAGSTIKVYRQTGVSAPERVFSDGAIMHGSDLNTGLAQPRERTEELESTVGELSARALRVPSGEAVPMLPGAAGRSDRLFAFGPSGGFSGEFTAEAVRSAILNATAALAGQGVADGVLFVHSGAGALIRNLQERGRDWVSIKDFGAVGNGVTDDTAAIQKALDAHDGVFVPPGNYLTSGLTATRDNQCIYGVGRASRLSFKAGEVGNHFDSNGHGITMRDLDWAGGYDSSHGGESEPTADRNALALDFDTNTVVDGVSIHGYQNQGIYPRNAVSNRGGGTTLQNILAYSNWMGINLGNAVAEYVRLSNITSNGARVGLKIGSGNVTGSVGCINDNYTNLWLYGGDADVPNDGHGNLSGFLFNHAIAYAVLAEDITFGFNLDGNQFFGGNIYLNNCRGISICYSEFELSGIQFKDGGRNYVCHNRLYTSTTEANAVTHAYEGVADDTLCYDNVQVRDIANPLAAPVVTQSTTRAILGRSDQTNADHVFLHMGETGIVEAYGLSWSSNGYTGKFKLRALNNNALSATPTMTVDRSSGKIEGLFLGLPAYADNAAAVAAGLPAGSAYATATGELRVVV